MIQVLHPTGKANFSTVKVGQLQVWFSYETAIAFNHPHVGLVARKNDWGPTTGKHFSQIPGMKEAHRVNGEEFETALEVFGSALVTS